MPVNSFDNYELSWKPDRSRIEPPLYLGLASMLERDILSGALSSGTKMPTMPSTKATQPRVAKRGFTAQK